MYTYMLVRSPHDQNGEQYNKLGLTIDTFLPGDSENF